MIDLVVENGCVITMGRDRTVLSDGAVAVDDGEIVAVGPTDEVTDAYAGRRVLDATDHAVVPGFIDSHAHVADILIRGADIHERDLFDWLLNVKKPAIHAMTPDDHAVAAALFCTEALRAGITTFVELPESFLLTDDDHERIVDAKLETYAAAGLRNVYAPTFEDEPDLVPDLQRRSDRSTRAESDVEHVPADETIVETGTAIAAISDLIDRHHDPSSESRQRVWVAPESAVTVSDEGLAAAAELAERKDVMTTTHVSEVEAQERATSMSYVEYLDAVGYLGERSLLAHCVQLDERDVRLLETSGTKVAHNPLTNLKLGSGIAPVPTMTGYGVTVGLGTDNPSASDTVSPLSDAQYAALIHRGARGDAGAVTAEKALEMATIDAARAIGRAEHLGSLEAGKRADLALIDLDYPHLTPRRNVVSALVFQTCGHEVDTVVCDGDVVMQDGDVPGIADRRPALSREARDRSEAVVERAGLAEAAARPWASQSPN